MILIMPIGAKSQLKGTKPFGKKTGSEAGSAETLPYREKLHKRFFYKRRAAVGKKSRSKDHVSRVDWRHANAAAFKGVVLSISGAYSQVGCQPTGTQSNGAQVGLESVNNAKTRAGRPTTCLPE
jgi:hypothetical protein